MPATRLIFFRASNGTVPVRAYMAELRKNRDLYAKCWQLLCALRDRGSELRRPQAEHLGGGIYELRVIFENIHVRFLYAFVGHDIVLLTHGFAKEGKVPAGEIARAAQMLQEWSSDREHHSA